MKIPSVVLAFSLSATAMAAKSQAEGSITKLLKGRGPDVTQSVVVERLSDGKVLFEKDGDQLVAPASVTKVITSAAALTRFTPAHVFQTPFYYTGTRKGDRITGDLVVVGDGDPFIVSEKLWQLAADMRNLGIRSFDGDLVIDNSLFDGESRDESRKGGTKTSHNAYDAPVSAFGINFNTYAVAIAPGDKPGRPAVVSMDPYPLHGVDLDNNVQTGKPHAGKQIQVNRTARKGDERLVASGSIAQDMPMQKVYRSVGNHVQMAGEYLKAFLKNEGISVHGRVKEGRKPDGATLLLTLDSYEMRKIVSGLNTFSNNYIADVLVKRLGAAFPKTGAPDAPGSGTFANGVHVLNQFLKQDVGITSNFVLENGSGLAIENRLSARQVVKVLAYMEKHMEVFPEFLGSLPASGWDGTLKKRFGKGEAEGLKGLFRAKTGTLTEPVSVSGIAGYFRHPKHGFVAFCILENGQKGEAQPAVTDLRDKQDQVLVAFMNEI